MSFGNNNVSCKHRVSGPSIEAEQLAFQPCIWKVRHLNPGLVTGYPLFGGFPQSLQTNRG
jgi:hypothetical protein